MSWVPFVTDLPSRPAEALGVERAMQLSLQPRNDRQCDDHEGQHSDGHVPQNAHRRAAAIEGRHR